MAISPARAAAFDILMRVENTDAYASELLHSGRFAKLSSADHGLLTELVMGVLRWRSVLDERIAEHSTQPLTKLDMEVLTTLRLGAYQLLFLDRIPTHAAVNESVELVKQAKKRSAAGMVNAVLRKIVRGDSQPPRGPRNRGENASEETHFSQNKGEVGHPMDFCAGHPRWLVERWRRNYGAEVAREICEYDQKAPEITIRVPNAPKPMENAEPSHPPGTTSGGPSSPARTRAAGATWSDSWDEVRAEGIQLDPGRLLGDAAVVIAGDLAKTQAFHEHRLVIQDEASQLVAMIVGRGKKILDCCAAPGGKTRILAEQNPGSLVVAMELHPHRAKLLRKLVPNESVRVLAADARRMPLRRKFDRVLVDAPCSGTGTLARNPEIKWRLRPADLLRLQEYQLQILSAAMQQVADSGRLIYSTCSLEPEENEAVIERMLAEDPTFHVVDCGDELQRLKKETELTIDDFRTLLSGPYLRTIQGVHACDGFFAAILQRT